MMLTYMFKTPDFEIGLIVVSHDGILVKYTLV